MSVSLIMAIELFPTEQRTFAGNAIEIAWVLGVITLAPVAYLIRDWRKLVFVTGIPGIISILVVWFVSNSTVIKIELVLLVASCYTVLHYIIPWTNTNQTKLIYLNQMIQNFNIFLMIFLF